MGEDTLGKHLDFSNGRSSPNRHEKGKYPVFGSNGLIGFADETNAPAGTTIIGRVGSYCGSLHFSKQPCWVTDNAIKAAPKRNGEGRFWFYALRTLNLEDLRSGSGQPLINQTALRAVTVAGIAYADSSSIANILSALDDKIELNRRTNETLEAMAQAIFRDWFVDFGPVRRKMQGETDCTTILGGLIDNPHQATTLATLFPDTLGENGVPQGWNTVPVYDLANWINGAAFKKMHFVDRLRGLPVVKIAELKSGITEQTKFTDTQLDTKFRIKNRELLFSWSGNPDTSIDAFVWTGGDAWLNQHIFAVRENGRRSLATLHTQLKALMPVFAEIARDKQTTGLGHVTRQDMKMLEVVEPDSALLQAFDTIVSPLYQRQIENEIQNQTLAQTRDYLLPKLMSGQVRAGETQGMRT
ncbi:MAG: restriction endonuclease subunit S [Hyphomonas sp.]|uniref:restriction endonuclease subunit S n=1 Tax=Hyphomonas sp. TaxID=87 RepID=UPI0032667CD7